MSTIGKAERDAAEAFISKTDMDMDYDLREIWYEAVRWSRVNPPAEVAALVEALEFYASGSHFETPNAKNNLLDAYLEDRGETAAEALAAYRAATKQEGEALK